MSPGNNATFSSSLLRERDQKILEKHAREKSELELRIQKLKKVNDARSKELFDALHRGDRLAHSIGFDNLYEAQVHLDSLDHSITFKECMGRIRILEAELTCEKKEVEILQVKLNKIEDNSRLHVELEQMKSELGNSEHRHQEEMKQLQERYDSLKVVKERAAERYKTDFKKWREFSKWLFAENDEHHKRRNEPGISKEEKKRQDVESVMRKRQNMFEMGPDLARFEGELDDSEGFRHPPPIGCTGLEADKENKTSSPQQKKTLSISDSSQSRPLQDIQLKEVSTTNSSSSPALFFTTGPPATSRTSLSFKPLLDHMQIKREPDTTPTNVGSRSTKRAYMPSSSDTEEDSQAVAFPSTNPRSGKLAVFKVPPPPMASGDPPSGRPKSPQESANSRGSSGKGCMGDSERPSKFQRLSDDLNVFAWFQDEATPCASKGKKKHEKNAATPLRAGENSNKVVDYSAFKGRGRYSGQIQNPEKTINAVYAIDPKSNDGKNYQYDEVVRNKDQRQKMHGGDCECCREYYKNVGPLPKRLQQPLWRSPSKTMRGDSEPPRHQAGIDAHQQAISRHRQTWARAKTPPGYWEIGFPNTQEVGDINEKAKEMEKKKRIEIENESNRGGGRYRKK